MLRGKKIRKSRKGAIELSMTTIIVIVIGITILSLGLVWIRGLFEDVGSLTKGAFEQAEGQIGEIFGQSDKALAISPTSLTLSQGSTERVNVLIQNFAGGDAPTISAKVENVQNKEGVVCAFLDTLKENSDIYSLGSGKQITIGLGVEAKDDALIGTYVCKVTVSGLAAEGEQKETVLITVE
ncbi:hypothetical protein HZB88_04135 [archaeon]|nr:hypothetical protein [archaeon]